MDKYEYISKNNHRKSVTSFRKLMLKLGWDGWMASLTQWTGVRASSGRWWGTGKPGVLQSMGLQRVGHTTEWPNNNPNAFLLEVNH